jgi:hypothetical protein
MSYLEELLPEFRNGAKIRRRCWVCGIDGICRSENYSFHAHDIDADDWEVVPDKPIDWNYIIKNKCLCWFWDNDDKYKSIEKLAGINNDEVYPFENTRGGVYRHCRPVRRDEITFYEDAKK